MTEHACLQTQAKKNSRKQHFCSCGDLECPFNPNNPANAEKNMGCDACIRKNLSYGEVPTCMFKNLGSAEGWNDWSVEGFARFVTQHPRPDDVRQEMADRAARFEQSYQHKSGV